MMEHVRSDLSAYLDGALAPTRRSEVDAHLRACAACQGSLAELRSAARLIAAIPAAAPSRRLVPDLAPRPNWLRPIRSLSAVGAGMFLLVFMASATLDTGFRMGGGRAGLPGAGAAAPAAAPAPAGAPAGQTAAATTPPAGFQATDQRTALTATPKTAAELARDAAATARTESVGVGSAAGTGGPEALRQTRAPEPLRIGPSPWLWLALGVLSALLALVAHRRLRAH